MFTVVEKCSVLAKPTKSKKVKTVELVSIVETIQVYLRLVTFNFGELRLMTQKLALVPRGARKFFDRRDKIKNKDTFFRWIE